MDEYLGWVVAGVVLTIVFPVVVRDVYERRRRRIDRRRSRRRTEKIKL